MCICSVTSGSTGRPIATVKDVFAAARNGELVYMGSQIAAILMERQLETTYRNGKCRNLYALTKRGNGFYRPYRIV